MKSSQEQMRSDQVSFQTSVQNRISNIESKLDKKFSNMHESLSQEICKVKQDFVQASVKSDEQLKGLESRISTIEAKVKNNPEKSSMAHKLIFKNIKYPQDISSLENKVLIKQTIDKIVEEICATDDIDVQIVDVEVLNNASKQDEQAQVSTGENTGPYRNRGRLVLGIYFRNEKERQHVLSNKKRLRGSDRFSHIYVETDKSRAERITENNIRQLIKNIPTLRMRGGKVVKTNDPQKIKEQPFTGNNDSSKDK